jgi:hypothetical protein
MTKRADDNNERARERERGREGKVQRPPVGENARLHAHYRSIDRSVWLSMTVCMREGEREGEKERRRETH